MQRTMLKSKSHRATVTHSELHYVGSVTVDAINSSDFALVRAVVFLGAVAYIIGNIMTDVSYALVNPRVRLAS